MFKWLCLLVAVVALSAYGWMLNDMRLEVRRLADKADNQLPKILAEAEQVTDQLNRQLPKLLTEAEQVTSQLNKHLPKILKEAEQVGATTSKQLPRLMTRADTALTNLADLSTDLRHVQGFMGMGVNPNNQNQGLLTYGSGLLDLIGGQDATIGVKAAPTDPKLHQAVPAKEWAKAAQKQNQFLSATANSKAEVLHALTRSKSASPWYVQLKDQAPRLLSDLIRELHPDRKGIE